MRWALVICIFLSGCIYDSYAPGTIEIESFAEPAKSFEEILKCEVTSDCVIVEYDHCCGSTKLAINKAYEDQYYNTPQWQEFSDPSYCSLIGKCPDDTSVTEASCELSQGDQRVCTLVK